jgi:hypothetical protein
MLLIFKLFLSLCRASREWLHYVPDVIPLGRGQGSAGLDNNLVAGNTVHIFIMHLELPATLDHGF